MSKICMTARQAVNEHRKLVKVLKHGTRKSLNEEAEEQGAELKQYRKKLQHKARRYARMGKGRRNRDRR